jgi:hypothetical protein
VRGAVAAQVGLAFDEQLQSIGQVDEAGKYLRNVANGYWEDPSLLGDDDYFVHVPGILVSPLPQLDETVQRALELTGTLLDALRKRWTACTTSRGSTSRPERRPGPSWPACSGDGCRMTSWTAPATSSGGRAADLLLLPSR